MKHWIKLLVALRFSFCITSFFLVAIPSAAGEELDAKNILKGLQLRITPPSQYRVKLGRFESVVSTKVLTSGIVAMRVEAAPPSQTAVIIRGDEYYDVLNQSKVVIHKSKMDPVNFPKDYLFGNELSKSFIARHPDSTLELSQSVALDRGAYLVTVTFSGPSIEGLDLESSPLAPHVVRKDEKKKRVRAATAIPESRLGGPVFLFGSLSIFLAGALVLLWKMSRVRGV